GSGSCHGCWSCWGGCSGCLGSCFGGWGSGLGSCGGCTGCGGGGMWGYWYANDPASSGCWGSGNGCYGSSCYGGYSSSYYGGSCYGCYGSTIAAGFVPAPIAVTAAAPATPAPTREDADIVAAPNRATLVVHLPADADLYIDGVRADLNSARRVLVSPALQPGRNYVYTLRTKTIRNGHPITQSRQVAVRAGALTRVDFGDASNKAPAQLSVHLPADAKLYVNNVLIPQAVARQPLDTPPLEQGKTYHYVLRAELNTTGQTRKETRQVNVQAGKLVEVRFNDLVPVKTAHR
ncbi:MAG TPA: TIGR03000 domain-containing protein, partial [Gemmataceae bacterium]|nr:TIGR03000 domain-containing protein [Gemmataceae bacterium]